MLILTRTQIFYLTNQIEKLKTLLLATRTDVSWNVSTLLATCYSLLITANLLEDLVLLH